MFKPSSARLGSAQSPRQSLRIVYSLKSFYNQEWYRYTSASFGLFENMAQLHIHVCVLVFRIKTSCLAIQSININQKTLSTLYYNLQSSISVHRDFSQKIFVGPRPVPGFQTVCLSFLFKYETWGLLQLQGLAKKLQCTFRFLYQLFCIKNLSLYS